MKSFKVLIDGQPNTLTQAYSNNVDVQYNTDGNKSAFTFRRGNGPGSWPLNTEVKTSGCTIIVLEILK